MKNKNACRVFRALNAYRDVIKFVDPRKPKAVPIWEAGEAHSLPTHPKDLIAMYECCEVPYEIAEDLFCQGYQQAILDIKRDLDRMVSDGNKD